VLDEFKQSMGSLDFAAQYQQEPVAEGGNLIKWDWFKFYQEPPARQSGDRIIVSWDTALSSKELSSYSACVVLHVKGETAYVLEVVRERLEYPDLKRKVIAVYRQWRNACSRFELVIENKGSGMSLIQDLKRESIYPVAVDPEGDKAMRMNAQKARIEAGSVLLPVRPPGSMTSALRSCPSRPVAIATRSMSFRRPYIALSLRLAASAGLALSIPTAARSTGLTEKALSTHHIMAVFQLGGDSGR